MPADIIAPGMVEDIENFLENVNLALRFPGNKEWMPILEHIKVCRPPNAAIVSTPSYSIIYGNISISEIVRRVR